MNKNKFWQVAAVVLLIAAAAGAYWYSSSAPQTDTAPQERPVAGMVTVVIEGVYDAAQTPITESETVLGVLQTLHNQSPGKVKLATKEYEGLGVLVDSMGTLKNGDNGEYWQYTVNGVMPQIGADKLVLKNGDKVEWYFAKSEY